MIFKNKTLILIHKELNEFSDKKQIKTGKIR